MNQINYQVKAAPPQNHRITREAYDKRQTGISAISNRQVGIRNGTISNRQIGVKPNKHN